MDDIRKDFRRKRACWSTVCDCIFPDHTHLIFAIFARHLGKISSIRNIFGYWAIFFDFN